MRAGLRRSLVEDEELKALARSACWGGNRKALKKLKSMAEEAQTGGATGPEWDHGTVDHGC